VQIFTNEMILARIKYFGILITALWKVQKVNFEKLALAFDASTLNGMIFLNLF